MSIWSEDKDGGNREGALQKGEIRGWEMNRSFVGGLIGIWKNAASERGIPGLPLPRWSEGRGGDDGAAKEVAEAVINDTKIDRGPNLPFPL